MLPELILREERQEKFILLVFLGLVAGFLGFGIARAVFPVEVAVLSVVFASIPLVYPLVKFFFDREKEDQYYIPEASMYSSLFLGQAIAFTVLGFFFPESFDLQREVVGAAGHAVEGGMFVSILSNNFFVFGAIFVSAALIGSAGAFILTWNASVLGVFMSSLVQDNILLPLAYVPHTTFEMGGFIVAGVSGTVVSAAIYREHFDTDLWRNIGVLFLAGLLLVVAGAVLETA